MQQVQIPGQGVYQTAVMQVDPAHRAARVSLRPPEMGVYGSYSIGLASGLMAAGLAGASPIFAFRWTTSSIICIIRKVRLTAGSDSTAFAQGSTIFDMIRATAFTVQDTSGATISLAGKSQAKSTSYAASQQQIASSATGNIAIAGTATLSAGTRTLDSNAMAILVGSAGAVPAINPVLQPGLLWDGSDPRKSELVLQNAEGFVIRATVPATGTWKFGVEVDWDEVDPARYF